jgi:hypothetical protein
MSPSKRDENPGAKAVRGFAFPALLRGLPMCQCAERRAVIVQAATGAIPVGQAAAFVARSALQDVRGIPAAAISAAKARLAGRRR